MRIERGGRALRNMQRLQGRSGLGIGERHGAELDKTHANSNEEGQRIEQGFVFKASIGHGRYCIKVLGNFVNDGAALLEDRREVDGKLFFIDRHGVALQRADVDIADIVLLHDGVGFIPA